MVLKVPVDQIGMLESVEPASEGGALKMIYVDVDDKNGKLPYGGKYFIQIQKTCCLFRESSCNKSN